MSACSIYIYIYSYSGANRWLIKILMSYLGKNASLYNLNYTRQTHIKESFQPGITKTPKYCLEY